MLNKENKPVRVAFYIRVSTEEQARDGYGADMQLEWLESMISYKEQHYGWTHNKKDEYIDLACTWSDLNREAFKRMMEDAKQNKFDIVAVYKIDRLSRNLSHLLGTFEILQANKVGFYSLKENVDFSGPIGRLTFQIFWALAEFERETIKIRTKDGKITSARAGNYVNNGTPFGYDRPKDKAIRVNRTLTINDDEAEWIKKIFSQFIKWGSLEWLAKMMNENKVLKSKHNLSKKRTTLWDPRYMRRNILNKPVYTGRGYFKSKNDNGEVEIIEIPVPRIISDIDFEVAQLRLENISKDAKRGGGKNNYLLSRKITDTETDRTFVWFPRKKGGKDFGHSYRRKVIVKGGIKYPNREIPGESLDESVWEYVLMYLKRPEELFEAYERQTLDGKDYERYTKEKDILNRELDKLESAYIAISDDYYAGKFSEERKDILIWTNEQRQSTIRKQIAELDGKLKSLIELNATKEALLGFTDKLQMDIKNLSLENKKYLISALVKDIPVTFTDKWTDIRINFRIKPPAQSNGDKKVEPKKSSSKAKKQDWSFKIATMEELESKVTYEISIYTKLRKEQIRGIWHTWLELMTRDEVRQSQEQKNNIKYHRLTYS